MADTHPDANVEAVLQDAARKAEQAKDAEKAAEAAQIDDDHRLRQDMVESVRPESFPETKRGRQFDVGGQPEQAPDFEARKAAKAPEAKKAG